MRRSDREITDIKEIERILKEAFVCHLGLVDGDRPYVVPMNYAYSDGCIYLHCASAGRKLDLIKVNNNVCFQMEITSSKIAKNTDQPCDWGTIYKSVIGTGYATLLTEGEEKKKALKAIIAPFCNKDITFNEGDFAATTIIRIDIEEMTGKKANC